MRIAFFSTQPYDKFFFERENVSGEFEYHFFESHLGPHIVQVVENIDALKTRKLAGLAIDVYEQEEKLFFKDLSGTIIEDDTIQRLMSFPNVLITATKHSSRRKR